LGGLFFSICKILNFIDNFWLVLRKNVDPGNDPIIIGNKRYYCLFGWCRVRFYRQRFSFCCRVMYVERNSGNKIRDFVCVSGYRNAFIFQNGILGNRNGIDRDIFSGGLRIVDSDVIDFYGFICIAVVYQISR
jgi:hypothetical protein